METPVFVGYSVKGPPLLGGPKFNGVTRICSVASCIRGDVNEPSPWDLNKASFYDDPNFAWKFVPEELKAQCDLLAFDLYPVIYRRGWGSASLLTIPEVTPTALPKDANFLGFDVATYEKTGSDSNGNIYYSAGHSPLSCTGHSPLSCNGRADEVQVNQCCLFVSYEAACQDAKLVSASDGKLGEPGDYVVFGVYDIPRKGT